MSAYVVIKLLSQDDVRRKRYASALRQLISDHQGQSLAADPAPITLEGRSALKELELVEFPDVARAQRFAMAAQHGSSADVALVTVVSPD